MLDREFSVFLAQLSVLTLRQQDEVREALKIAECGLIDRFTEVVRSPEQCPHCRQALASCAFGGMPPSHSKSALDRPSYGQSTGLG